MRAHRPAGSSARKSPRSALLYAADLLGFCSNMAIHTPDDTVGPSSAATHTTTLRVPPNFHMARNIGPQHVPSDFGPQHASLYGPCHVEVRRNPERGCVRRRRARAHGVVG